LSENKLRRSFPGTALVSGGENFMPTRFDHIVIAVRDLDAAIRSYQRLGFDATPGGRHTGRGTQNALIRFGLDYIELLSVYNEAEAAASGLRGQIIVDYLREREALLLGYALATTDIEQEAERFRGTDLLVQEPFPMLRLRPDGHLLSWRLFVPGGSSWRQPWPFLIQWDEPDQERLKKDLPGTHPNGATAWVRIVVLTQDLDRSIDLYQNQLGLPLIQRDSCSRLIAHRAGFSIGNSTILLATPSGSGPAQEELEKIGEGPYDVSIAVKNLEQTRSYLAQHDVSFQWDAANPKTLRISPLERCPEELSSL